MGSRRWLIGKYRPISEFCHINILCRLLWTKFFPSHSFFGP